MTGARAGEGTGSREGQGRDSAARRRAGILGVAALALMSALGCAAGTGAAPEATAGPFEAATAPAPAPPAAPAAGDRRGSGPPAAQPVPAPAASGRSAGAGREILAGVLRKAFENGSPGAGQLRGALAAAGFPAGDVQVTADRTPTGLEADAVEVGVRRGGECLVAQVRSGAVSIAVLPVLADGRCLAGAAAP